MTKPSITYGQGWLDDCNKLTGLTYGDWKETDPDGKLITTAVSDDWFYSIKLAGGTDPYLSYPDESGANNLSLSTTIYKKIRWRFKGLSGAVFAKIVAVFSDASTQTVLSDTASTTFTCNSTTLTSGKILDHIRLYVTGGGYLFYDFIMVYKDDFTFPNTAYGRRYIPAPRNISQEYPQRTSDIIQNLGSKSARFHCECDLDVGTWTRTGDTNKGQVFEDISHNSWLEPFQWLDTGMGRQFKVVMDGEPTFEEFGDKHNLSLEFKECSRSSKSNETYAERFGVG